MVHFLFACRQEEDKTRCLLRFLSACSGDVDGAVKMLKDDLQWRESMGAFEMRNAGLEEILEDADARLAIDEMLPTVIIGRDLQVGCMRAV